MYMQKYGIKVSETFFYLSDVKFCNLEKFLCQNGIEYKKVIELNHMQEIQLVYIDLSVNDLFNIIKIYIL